MSGFFSRRYLEARRAQSGAPIDEDRFCRHCGFNLRGLRPGGACPECGTAIPLALRAGDDDPYLDLPGDERARVRRGLRLAMLVLVVAALAKWCYLLPGAFAWTPGLKLGYRAVGLACAIAWIAAVPMLLPAGWRALDPRFARARRWLVGLSLAWVPAAIALVLLAWLPTAAGPTPIDGLRFLLAIVGDGGRFAGGVAAIGILLVHERACELAGLDDPRRRFAFGAWMLVPTSLLGQVFPTNVALFTMVLVAFVAFFWSWALLAAADGCRRAASHLAWARRHAIDAGSRDERVAAARAALDDEVRRSVRSLPGRRE